MNGPKSSALVSVFGATRAPDESWLARAAPEAPLDAALPIVDPHVHFWHHGSGYRYFVEEFSRDVAASGHDVEATVFIECNAFYRAGGPAHIRSVGETEFAVGQAAIAASGKYTTCRAAAAIVGFADLTLGERTLETIDAHVAAANGRFRGVRQRAKWDPDPAVRGPVSASGPGLYLQAGFIRGVKALARKGLLFEASIFHPQLPDVAALARQCPEARIVVIHSGSPVGHASYRGLDAEVHRTWLAGMRELAQCPNVAVKMGGLLMCLGSFDFTTADRPPDSQTLAELWRPYIEPCIELLGPDRCMVSSNFPVDKAGIPYGTIWNMFKRVTAGLPDEDRLKILGRTARRIYGID